MDEDDTSNEEDDADEDEKGPIAHSDLDRNEEGGRTHGHQDSTNDGKANALPRNKRACVNNTIVRNYLAVLLPYPTPLQSPPDRCKIFLQIPAQIAYGLTMDNERHPLPEDVCTFCTCLGRHASPLGRQDGRLRRFASHISASHVRR